MTDPIRVLLVDDQPTVRHGIRLHLSCEPDIEIAGEIGDGATAVELATSLAPDVVVLDIAMPGMDGFEAARRIRATRGPAIVMLSLHDDAISRGRAMEAGADAFVSKSGLTNQLVVAIHTVARGPEAEPAHTDPGQIQTGGA